MGRVLDLTPASWPGKQECTDPIAYEVTNLPNGMEISIEKRLHEHHWCIVRSDGGSQLVRDGYYASAKEALEALREEFPG